jgi:hypothetical protein
MRYEQIKRRDHATIDAMLDSGNVADIVDALHSAAYWDPDWRWAQERLLRFSTHESDDVAWAVASGLGLLAAFHGQLDLDRAESVLRNLMNRPAIRESVEAVVDEVERFVKLKVGPAQRLPEESERSQT